MTPRDAPAGSADTAPYRASADGVRLAVKLTPKARRAGFDGIAQGADGARLVKARVTAPPEGGKANKALLALLGKAIGIAPSRLAIASGEAARHKTIQITGDNADIRAKLDRWLGEMA